MRQLRIIQSFTNRESISLEKYLQEVSKEGLVTVEEEVELAQRIKKGDRDAVDKLVRANLRFVISVAKQYKDQGLSLSDLINEGNLGLIKAAERFDETRGFRFISYAVWWIRQSILSAINDQSRVIRLPLNRKSLLNKINKFSSKFEQDNERNPSVDEIADFFDLTPVEISESLRAQSRQISFDSSFNGEEDYGFLDILVDGESPSPDKTLMLESLSFEIERVLNTLPAREADVIRMFYGINCRKMTIGEISEKLNLVPERVRQIKEKTIKLMRSPYRSHHLKKFFD